MMNPTNHAAVAIGAGLVLLIGLTGPGPTAGSQKANALPPRQMEHLDRGLVAIHQGDGKVFVS